MLRTITDFLNGIIWSDTMTYLCLITGIIFTFALKGVQATKIKDMVKLSFVNDKSKTGISSFQAFVVAVAGRVGTGNIVGVATAICFGGPGAIFWMWVLAFLGAATSCAECALAQLYKQKIGGQYVGGPAYSIRYGLNSKWLAAIFAVCGFFGNLVFHPSLQANAIADAVNNAFGINEIVTTCIVCLLLALIVFGGVNRIASVCEKAVPVMSVGYILMAIILVIFNIEKVPSVFSMIFTSAFGANAVFGGMLGSAIAWGVKRGVYSSEAGMGTASQAAAAADVSHPAKQGLVQAFSIYIDTLFVCTATALMMLITGMYNVQNEATGEFLYNALPGMEAGSGFIQSAMDSFIPSFGSAFVAIALFLFAFTTLMSCYIIGESNILFLFPKLGDSKLGMGLIRALFLVCAFIGCVVPSQMAWDWADIGLGSCTWLTVISCLLLIKPSVKLCRDYCEQKKQGLDPIFRPSKVGIKNADLWEEIADEYEKRACEEKGSNV